MNLIDVDELITHSCRDELYKREQIAEMIAKAPMIIEVPIEHWIDKVPTGHWIDRWWEEGCEGDCVRWRCSECKELSCCNSNFCGNCGAKMVEPQESEDKE